MSRRGRPAELTVAGQFRWPGAHEQIRGAIEQANAGQWINLRPAYTQEEAVKMLQESHILLHLKYHDPCPTAVIEATACGIPVIGSHSGGLPELLETAGGDLLPVPQSWDTRHYPDPSDLAAAIEKIMTPWPAHSASARAHAEKHFDHIAWVQRHREIFERLLETKALAK